MAINFAAASTAGLNNPGTEIITLVKDVNGNFVNPPSYDKMRAYLSSGDVPCLFVTNEAGETGSLYQFVEYAETENKIRFSNDKTTIAFSAGSGVPVETEVGGGGGSGSGQFIINVSPANQSGTIFNADKTYEEITAAIESGIEVVIHYIKSTTSPTYDVYHHSSATNGDYVFYNVKHTITSVYADFIDIYVENGKMGIDKKHTQLQVVT